MKLDSELGVVERSGVKQEFGFRIQASKKAFDILSSKIYTDPILAIVRELSTNASDAHIAAGYKDSPFDVYLPVYTDRTFKIRDYGTGLSKNDVRNVYSVYFHSTRNESNEFTGALGLGSKSPFSYVDNFMVTSFYNGEKTIFSLFKNEQGVPSVAELLSEKTDEPNGIEIEIPVIDLYDIVKFQSAAEKVYKHFYVFPNIKRGECKKTPDNKIALSGDNYVIYETPNSYGMTISLLMGQVSYKVELLRLHSDVQKLYNSTIHSIVVDAPIGACTVSANREELQYDDITVSYVSGILSKAIKDIEDLYAKFLASNPSELSKARSGTNLFKIVSRKDAMLFHSSDYDFGYRLKEILICGSDSHKSIHQKLINPTTIIVEWDTTNKFRGDHIRIVREFCRTKYPNINNINVIGANCSKTPFITLFGNPAFKLSEAIAWNRANTPRVKVPRTDYKSKIRLFNKTHYIKSSDVVKGSYYILTHRNRYNLKDSPRLYEDIKRVLSMLDIKVDNIYQVLISRKDIDPKRYDLKSLEDLIIKEATKFLKSNKSLLGIKSQYDFYDWFSFFEKNYNNGSITPSKLVEDFIEAIKEHKKSNVDVESINWLKQYLKIEIDGIKDISIVDTFPLLQLISSYELKQEKVEKELIHYINAKIKLTENEQ